MACSWTSHSSTVLQTVQAPPVWAMASSHSLAVFSLKRFVDAVAPELDGVRADIGAVQVFHVLDPLGAAGGLQELAGEALVHALILDVSAIGALVLVGHDIPWEGEQVGGIDVVEVGQVASHGGEHGAVERHLDALAPSGALAGDEGHGDGDRADDGGEGAGCGQGKEERLVHAGNALVGAGGSADDGLPAAVVAVGAILAEAGEGAVDESGVVDLVAS